MPSILSILMERSRDFYRHSVHRAIVSLIELLATSFRYTVPVSRPVLVGVIALAVGAGSAFARQIPERRVALVVGNTEYTHSEKLPNARNDAKAMAATLRDLGFEVIEGIDLTKDSFYATAEEFLQSAQEADVALFFYSGHGLEIRGQNYLMPINANLRGRLALASELIALGDIMQSMSGGRRKLNLVFLDACRGNALPEEADQVATGQGTPVRDAGVCGCQRGRANFLCGTSGEHGRGW